MKSAIPAILLPFVLLVTVSSVAQSIDIRKRWDQLTGGSEVERIEAAKELSLYYQSESIDSLRMVGETLFFFGIDNHYQPAIEFGKITLAEFYVMTGRINDGIVMAKSTIQALQERGDLELLSNVCRIISSGYRKLEDGNSSMLWALKAIAYTKNDPDAKDRTAGMISLAEAYLLKHQEQKAIQTYQDYIAEATKAKNYRGLSSAYSRLGDIYRISQKLNLAEKYFTLAFQAAQKTDLKSPKAHSLNNLAIVCFEKGDTSAAKTHFMAALAIREAVNDIKAISESYYNLGDYHFYLDQFPQALAWYERSAQFAEERHLLNEEKEALLAMARVYRETKAFDESTRCLEKAVMILADLKLKQNAHDEELTLLQHEIWKSNFEGKEVKEIRQETSSFSYILLILTIGLLITVIFLAIRLNTKKA